ncbi:hypothetical protein OS493_023471 [Desmophyllum pertusum]|uniref:Uncharacterized protein n=1 Tax=Desmophyllum pertusum TaxID=174260 RepID=A0A9W9ZNQ3_9CNID|nr:hypothetical protein OS493_023471 [Desmophyllum pertusum]
MYEFAHRPQTIFNNKTRSGWVWSMVITWPTTLESQCSRNFSPIIPRMTDRLVRLSWQCTQTSPRPASQHHSQSAVLRGRGTTRVTELTCELTVNPKMASSFLLAEWLSGMIIILNWRKVKFDTKEDVDSGASTGVAMAMLLQVALVVILAMFH